MVLGLDMRFLGEKCKNKCKGNKQKQIPYGDDNQKCKGRGKTRGCFPFDKLRVRMTAETKNSKSRSGVEILVGKGSRDGGWLSASGFFPFGSE